MSVAACNKSRSVAITVAQKRKRGTLLGHRAFLVKSGGLAAVEHAAWRQLVSLCGQNDRGDELGHGVMSFWVMGEWGAGLVAVESAFGEELLGEIRRAVGVRRCVCDTSEGQRSEDCDRSESAVHLMSPFGMIDWVCFNAVCMSLLT
jgi:hypothetical protein